MKNKPYKERILELETEIAISNSDFVHQKRSSDSWTNFALISNAFWIIVVLLILFT